MFKPVGPVAPLTDPVMCDMFCPFCNASARENRK